MSKDIVLEVKVRRIASKGNDKEMFDVYSSILLDYDQIKGDGYSLKTVLHCYKEDYKNNPRVYSVLDNLWDDLFGEEEQ